LPRCNRVVGFFLPVECYAKVGPRASVVAGKFENGAPGLFRLFPIARCLEPSRSFVLGADLIGLRFCVLSQCGKADQKQGQQTGETRVPLELVIKRPHECERIIHNGIFYFERDLFIGLIQP